MIPLALIEQGGPETRTSFTLGRGSISVPRKCQAKAP